MTHLSIKALRHYHDVGLLEPAEIDPTSGYRFYEPSQVPIAQVIRRFRDLGMPLDQIKDVLQAPDVPSRNQLMVAHLRRMESAGAKCCWPAFGTDPRARLPHASRLTPRPHGTSLSPTAAQRTG